MRLRLLLLVVLTCSFAMPTPAESPEHAYKAGARAERTNDLDTAFQAFKQAHDDRPNDPKYMAAYLRLRSSASTRHIHLGQGLLDQHNLQDALAEFRTAAQIDPSNFEALGLIQRTTDEIQKAQRDKENALKPTEEIPDLEREASNAAGPIKLVYRENVPVSIQMTFDCRHDLQDNRQAWRSQCPAGPGIQTAKDHF